MARREADLQRKFSRQIPAFKSRSRRWHKVVFTGEGADEILAGYPGERRDTILFGGHHASDTARQASIDQLIAANPMTRSIFFPPEPAAAGTWLLSDALGHCPSWIEGMSCMYIGSTDLMRQDFSGSDDLDAPYRRLVEELDIPHTLAGRDAVNIGLASWQHTLLINFILTVIGWRWRIRSRGVCRFSITG